MTAIIHDVFDSLPEQIKRIPPPRVVMSPEVAGSAYAFGQIYLSPGQRQGAWFDTHLVHEYAHHVAVKTGVCKTPEFKAAMLDCIERAKGLSVDDIETQTKTTNDAISHEIAYMFLIALEGEEWGSVKDYFKNRPGIHEEEVFAVALQAYMHYSNRFWKMFPKMKEFFDERYGDNEKSITLPWLTKKLGDIRGDSIKQSRGGVRAHWHDYAKKANIDPDELHTIAAEYKHHHDEAAGEKHNMLKRAREFSVKNGFGNISQLRRMNANGKIDSSMLRGFDEIAEDAANNYPHFFKDDSAGEGSNLDQLFEMLTNDAKPEEMDWEEAYKFAANHIDSKPEREPGSDEDVSDAEEFGLGSDSNDFDFGANKQRDINPDEFKEIPKDQKQRGAFGDDEPSKEADPHADAKKLESKLAKKNPNGFTGIKRNQGFIHGTKVDSDTYDRHRALEKSREPTPEPAQAPAPAPAQPQQAAPMPANQPSNPSAASKPKDPGAQTNFTGVSFGNYFINGQKVDEATYHAYAEQKKQQAKNQAQTGKPTDRTNPDLDAFFGATPAQKPAAAPVKESRPNTDIEDFFNGTKSKPQQAPAQQVKPTGNLPHHKTQANVLNAANEYARNAKNPDHDAREAAFKKARSALKDHHAAGIAHLDSLQTGGNRRQIAKAKKAFTDRMRAIESKLGALGGFQARVKTQTPVPGIPVKQNQAAGTPKPVEPPPINPQYGRSRDQHKLTQQHLHERQKQSMRDLQDKHDQQLEALQRRLSGRGGPRLNMRGGLLGLAAGMMAGDNRAKNRRLIEQLKDKQAHIEAKLAKRHKVQRQQMANRHKLRISQIPTTKKGLMEWLTPSIEPIAVVGRLPWMTKAIYDESLHPRDDHGRFISKGDIEAAQGNHEVADALRKRVSDPEQRKLLESQLGAVGEKKKGDGKKADITETPAFKAWFGESVVVDDLDNPKETHSIKTVFHGAGAKFEKFDKEKVGKNGSQAGNGFYFAEDKRVADLYAEAQKGGIVEAFLKIENPFDFDSLLNRESLDKWAEKAAKIFHPFNKELFKLEFESRFKYAESNLITGESAWTALANVVGMGKVNRALAYLGYDGITHRARDQYGTIASSKDKGAFGRVWVAFEPSQIKSVDNEGTFDPKDDRIHKTLHLPWLTKNAAFEALHPRANDGKFGRKPSRGGRGLFDETDSGDLVYAFEHDQPKNESVERSQVKAEAGTGDSQTRVGKDGTIYARAPKGGATSNVNGKFYEGGQWMPIHGLSEPKKPIPPNGQKLTGVDGQNIPFEKEGEKSEWTERTVMTPEQIEAERKRRKEEEQKYWLKHSDFGRILGIHYSHVYGYTHEFNRKDLLDYVKEIGEDKSRKLLEKYQAIISSDSFLTNEKIKKAYGYQFEKETIEFEDKNSYLPKSVLKKYPSFLPIRRVLEFYLDHKAGGQEDFDMYETYVSLSDEFDALKPKKDSVSTEERRALDNLAKTHRIWPNKFDGKTQAGKKVKAGDGYVRKLPNGKYETLTLEEVKTILGL